uniref:L-Fucosyltransferase n=1 Tax=Panagrolaimus sp. JU765 TaxID=591449 RepID=A0AC34R3L7_9BILA
MASLYGIGRYTGRLPYFDASNSKQMSYIQELTNIVPKMMEVIQIKSPPESWVKKYEFAHYDTGVYDHVEKFMDLDDKYIKVKGNWLQCYKFFNKFQDEIRELYTCGEEIMKNATKVGEKMFENDDSFRLCAHLRRGDFMEYNLLETREEFVGPALQYATEYIKHKLKKTNISIIFIGDDQNFMKTVANNLSPKHKITVLKTANRDADLCFGINYCEAMLETSSRSTFAWWISYLMKPDSPVFYNIVTHEPELPYGNQDFDVFPPHWIALRLVNGVVVRERKWWHQTNNRTPFVANRTLTEWKD